VPYPYEAMEEAIVNAIYHRGYDGQQEPNKIYLYPDRMEIISYPGPVAGIEKKHFEKGQTIPPVPARNRRVGEFLKDLKLAEGRGTGIPKIQRKMKENGSPEPIFDFDDMKNYFRVILPVHPRYEVLNALRKAENHWAVGEKRDAINHLMKVYDNQSSSGALASQVIEYAFHMSDVTLARDIFNTFIKESKKSEESLPYLAMARNYITRGEYVIGMKILKEIPIFPSISDKLEIAILKKKSRDFKGAHKLFSELFTQNPDDPKIIHEFAQTKIRLAKEYR